MSERVITEPDVEDVAVQDKPKRAYKRRSKAEKDAIAEGETKAIKTFLQGCEQFESEAIRILLNFSKSNESVCALDHDDANIVSRYMNNGLRDVKVNCIKDVRNHRRCQAKKLTDVMKRYVDETAFMRILNVVIDVAIDDEFVESAYTIVSAKPQ